MRAGIWALLLSCALPLAGQAQYFPRLLWQRFYGTQGHDEPTRLVAGPDSVLYLAFNSRVAATGRHVATVAKLNASGKELWRRRFASANARITTLALRDTMLAAGGQLAPSSGEEEGGSQYGSDAWWGGLSARSGQERWFQGARSTGGDHTAAVAFDRYGGCMAAGTAGASSADFPADRGQVAPNLWFHLMNRKGQGLRTQVMGEALPEFLVDMVAVPTGDYFVLVEKHLPSNSGGLPVAVWFLLRLDFAGTLQWERQLADLPLGAMPMRLAPSRSKGVWVVGTDGEGGSRQFWVSRLDEQGVQLFSTSWGDFGHEVLTALQEMPDGGAVATGWSRYDDWKDPRFKGREDLWVWRLDARGNRLWGQTYGGPANERGVDIAVLDANTVAVLGQKVNVFDKTNPGGSGEDAWVLLLQESPCPSQPVQIGWAATESGIAQPGKPLQFLNQTPAIGGELWHWDFGDGTESTERQPAKTYTRPGSYRVQATRWLSEGCVEKVALDRPIIVR